MVFFAGKLGLLISGIYLPMRPKKYILREIEWKRYTYKDFPLTILYHRHHLKYFYHFRAP